MKRLWGKLWRCIPDGWSLSFINDWIPEDSDGGTRYRFHPLSIAVTECPGTPRCPAKHVDFVLVVLNFGVELMLEWLPAVPVEVSKEGAALRMQRRVAHEILNEAARMKSLFSNPVYSPHEAVGILEEEFTEFKDEVHLFKETRDKRPQEQMRTELLQLAAVSLNCVVDLFDQKEGG